MDIVVEKGPTPFGPGPIVGEFNAVGIPAKIDKGKVAIQKTVTAVEKGQPISADLGIMLSKLDINPIEIGIILTGAMEDGLVLMADDLRHQCGGCEGRSDYRCFWSIQSCMSNYVLHSSNNAFPDSQSKG